MLKLNCIQNNIWQIIIQILWLVSNFQLFMKRLQKEILFKRPSRWKHVGIYQIQNKSHKVMFLRFLCYHPEYTNVLCVSYETLFCVICFFKIFNLDSTNHLIYFWNITKRVIFNYTSSIRCSECDVPDVLSFK